MTLHVITKVLKLVAKGQKSLVRILKMALFALKCTDIGPLDEHDHDRCLLQVLNRCKEVGLKHHAAKCIFKAKQVVFYGHLVYTNGLSPDPRKVQAISNMPVPSNKIELQSYIGMCNLLSSYVPHLTDRLYVL